MALTRLMGTLLTLCTSLSLLCVASAQIVAPANGNSSGNPPQFILQTTQVMGTSLIKIYPLTNDAGLAGSQQQLNVGLASSLSSPHG